jgi:hypothetical protein
MDFLVPLYQGDKNILFANPKYTPNDQEGWEVNLGLGYRHMLFDDSVIIGLNGFFDRRKTPWGSIHEQWGVGAEAMAELPVGEINLGLTGRFNYYRPITSARIETTMGDPDGYIFMGNGIYSSYGVLDATIEEPLTGFDAEIGMRVPYVSDYVETWVYGGGYHFEGKYFNDIDGVSARLEVIPTDFLRLNYEYRQDRTNSHKGGDHYGEIMFEVPFSIDNLFAGKNPFEGLGKRFGGSRELKERLVEPVRRDVDVVVYLISGPHAKRLLKDMGMVTAGGGKPLKLLIFVSESGNDETGDGSYERPYNSIGRAFEDGRIRRKEIRLVHVMANGPGYAGGDWENWRGSKYSDELYDEYDISEDTDRLDRGPSSLVGTAHIEGVEIWGAGVVNSEFPNIHNFLLGFPRIGNTLTIFAPGITVRGLEFNILDDNSALLLRFGKDVRIEGNIFNVNNTSLSFPDAYGVSSYETNWQFNGSLGRARLATTRFLDSSGVIANGTLYIGGNDLNINSTNGNACGVNLHTMGEEGCGVDIKGNRFNVTAGDDAYGIKLENSLEFLGIPGLIPDPILLGGSLGAAIHNNTINVESTGYDKAYGISYNGVNSYITAGILNNDITVKAFGHPEYYHPHDSYGIYLNSEKNYDIVYIPSLLFIDNMLVDLVATEAVNLVLQEILQEYLPFKFPMYGVFYNNTLDVKNSIDGAYGISCTSHDDFLAVIRNNDMSWKSVDKGGVRGRISLGTYLYSTYGSFNTFIQDNDFYVSSGSNEAWGIYGWAEKNINAHIGNWQLLPETENKKAPTNTFRVTSDSFRATGIRLYSDEGYILGEIVNNSMVGGISGSSGGGISIKGFNVGFDGSDMNNPIIRPLIVRDNQLRITNGGGIGVGARNYLFTEITHNNMGEGPCYISGTGSGIGVRGDNGLGSPEQPVIIEDNCVKIIGEDSNDGGYGISASGGWNSDSAPVFSFYPEIRNNKIYIDCAYSANGITIEVSHPHGQYMGNIGAENKPLVISDNILSISSSEGPAYGISITSDNNTVDYGKVFANINHNLMSPGEYGLFTGTGIYGNTGAVGIDIWTYWRGGGTSGTDLGSVNSPLTIEWNNITVTSDNGLCYGIRSHSSLNSNGTAFLAIKHNDLSSGTGVSGSGDTYGISIENIKIGSSDQPSLFGSNKMRIKSSNGSGYGINLSSRGQLFADIVRCDDEYPLRNEISVLGELNAVGIMAKVGNLISGNAENPITISDSTITVDSEYSTAYGIYFYNNTYGVQVPPLYIDIEANTLNVTKGVLDINSDGSVITSNSSSTSSTGVYLYEGYGIGDINNPVKLTGNRMYITSVMSPATGFYLNSTSGKVFAHIIDNPYIKVDSPESTVASIRGDLIGDWTNRVPTFFRANTGAVYGPKPILLALYDTNSAAITNHYIHMGTGPKGMGSNNFQPIDASWYGNYGAHNEVLFGTLRNPRPVTFSGHVVP